MSCDQFASLPHKDKDHLELRTNFRVTKKFLITMFDCIPFSIETNGLSRSRIIINYLAGVREQSETHIRRCLRDGF